MDEKDKVELKKFSTNVMIEVAKLLVTLGSGFIVLSISFLGFVNRSPPSGNTQYFWLILVAWVCAIFSIIFGILSLGSIATTTNDKLIFDVDDRATSLFLKAQQIFFVFAFIFFCLFAAAVH